MSKPKKPKPHPAMTATTHRLGAPVWTQRDDGAWLARVGVFNLEVTATDAHAPLDQMPAVRITADVSGAEWDALRPPDVFTLRYALAEMARATHRDRSEARRDADDPAARAALKRLCGRVAKAGVGGWCGYLGRGHIVAGRDGDGFRAALRRQCSMSGSVVEVLTGKGATPADAITAMLEGAPKRGARGAALMTDAELAQMRARWAAGG